MSGGGGGWSGPDSRVETISRLAQWRVDTFGPCSSYRRSDPFKLGIWNWHLSVEKSRSIYVRLFPEPGRLSKEQPPLARFVLRVSWAGPPRRSRVSPVLEQLLRSSDDFVWQVDAMFHGRFTIAVEFLDLRAATTNATESPSSVWPTEGTVQSIASGGLMEGSVSVTLTGEQATQWENWQQKKASKTHHDSTYFGNFANYAHVGKGTQAHAFTSTSKHPHIDWIIDSGASKYVTGSLNAFETYTSYTNSETI